MKSSLYSITDTFSYRRIYTNEFDDTTDDQNTCRCFGIVFDSQNFSQNYMTGLLIRDQSTEQALLINECGIQIIDNEYPLSNSSIEEYQDVCFLANGTTYNLTQKADKTDLDTKLNTSDSITDTEIIGLFS